MNAAQKKSSLRKNALNKRMNEDKTILNELSCKITDTLQKVPEFKKADYVLFYMPIKNEVNVSPLIEKYLKTKNIVLPKLYRNWKMLLHKINSLNDLEMGQFHIPSPKEECEIIEPYRINLIIVPGIGFDQKGNRLGFGKGFYDKLLKETKSYKVGVCYEFQMQKEIPIEDHDEKMDLIITDQNIYHIS